MKKSTSWTVFIYGALMIAGGLIGFFTAGSIASLISGTVFGVLLIISSMFLFAKKLEGLYAAAGLTLVLTAFFTFRYTLTTNPHLLGFILLSAGVLLYLIAQLSKLRKA